MKKTQRRPRQPLSRVTRSAGEIRDSLREAITNANEVRKHYRRCGFAVVRDPSKLNEGKGLLAAFQRYALQLEQANLYVVQEKTTLTRLMKQISDEEAIALKATEKLMKEEWTTEVEDAE